MGNTCCACGDNNQADQNKGDGAPSKLDINFNLAILCKGLKNGKAAQARGGINDDEDDDENDDNSLSFNSKSNSKDSIG